MRSTAFSILISALLGLQLSAVDPAPPPKPASSKSTIKFPDPPPPKEDPADQPKVEPTPAPSLPIPVLGDGVYYVIHDDAPFLVYASPPGLVKITKSSGPATFLGVFIDGTGKFEEKKYSAKNIVTITAASTGRVELIVSPVGAADESAAIRKVIDVESGMGPIPPPKPVIPKVDPTVPVPPKTLRIIFVLESGATLPVGQQSVVDAKIVRDWVIANTTNDGKQYGWRRYDPDEDVTNESPAMKAIWEAAKPKLTKIPCVVVAADNKIDIVAYPASAAAAVELFKKYKNGEVK